MSSNSSPVILVTGCSTGIGRSIASAALDRGYRVISTARRIETIGDLGERGAETLSLDLTASAEDMLRFGNKAIVVFGQIDIIVNNAGYLQWGAMEETTPDQFHAQFETNFFGTVNLTNAFLPHFRERKSGTIVNISSQSTFQIFPGAGAYAASKAALDSATRTWATELEPFNVRCVSVNPGLFRSAVSVNMVHPSREIEGYDDAHKFHDWYVENGANVQGDPDKAAQKILDLATTPGKLPARFPLGDDAVAGLDEDIKRQVKELEQWRALGSGTDVESIP